MTGLTLMCVNPVFTQGPGGLNMLLCAAMCLSPLVLLAPGCRVVLPRVDVPMVLIALCVLLFPAIFHPDTVRPSTQLYTCAWCIWIMMAARVFKTSALNHRDYNNLTAGIIYVLTGVLIIQQICVIAGLPVPFTERWTEDATLYFTSQPFKLNSLTYERSHLVITIGVLMVYRGLWPGIKMGFLKELHSNPWVWGCFLWTCATTGGTAGILMPVLAVMPWIKGRRSISAAFAVILLCGAVATIVPGTPNPLKRVAETVRHTVRYDERELMNREISIGARITTSVNGAKALPGKLNEMMTGRGVDADQRDLVSGLKGGKGGIMTMAYNYGIPCELILWIFVLGVLRPRNLTTWFITLLALFLLGDYNFQLGWLPVMTAMCMEYSPEYEGLPPGIPLYFNKNSKPHPIQIQGS